MSAACLHVRCEVEVDTIRAKTYDRINTAAEEEKICITHVRIVYFKNIVHKIQYIRAFVY